MINDFIKIGDKQGDCIVFPERNQGRVDNTAKIGPDQIDITNQYLSALALEYKLLTRNNQNTDETIEEIFYLIKTINRLDARADFFWSSPPILDDLTGYPENVFLNGFMLREDMPHTYITNNLTHYNYELLEAGYTGNPSSLSNPINTYKSFTGLEHINALYGGNKFIDYTGFTTGLANQPKIQQTLPHDKYYSMLLAFMFIKKYIPAGTAYIKNGIVQSFQDGETDIREEVVKITNRCHPYLRGNTFGDPGSNWIMEYPDGTNLNDLGQPFPYSHAIAKMICHINDSYLLVFIVIATKILHHFLLVYRLIIIYGYIQCLA